MQASQQSRQKFEEMLQWSINLRGKRRVNIVEQGSLQKLLKLLVSPIVGAIT